MAGSDDLHREDAKARRREELFYGPCQVLSYLKASRLPVGLVMNFAGGTLKEGLKRIIL
jgi:PD-(D/E)XK nuclease superfamily